MPFPQVGQTLYGGWTQEGEGYADLKTRFSSFNTRAAGLVCDGVANDRAAMDLLVNTTMQAAGGELDIVGTPRIGSNMTFPANVKLNFRSNAKLSIDAGVTITINGPIGAPLSQIFSGLGTVVFGLGRISILYPQWWGALGDGVADDAPAVSKTIAALGVGARIHFVAGRYLFVTATTALPAAKIAITGDPGSVIVRDKNLAYCFTANAKDYLTLDGMNFETDPTTVGFTQLLKFVFFTSCNKGTVTHCKFNSKNALAQPTMFSQLHLQYCNDWNVEENWFEGSYGNCTGADSNAGVGGQNNVFTRNHFIDFVDTGLGLWTGAYNNIVIGNEFRALPIPPGATLANAANYSRVSIDCAGAQKNNIKGNTIIGGTIGIRYVTNLIYNNTDNEIEGNEIGEQEGSHDGAGVIIEPPQCIKIFESNGVETSVRIRNNQLRPVAGGWAITGYAAGGAASVVRLEIDQNLVIATVATASGMTLQGLGGNGVFKMIPGQNTWKFSGGATPFGSMGGAAAVVAFIMLERTRYTIADHRAPWNPAVNFNNAATLNQVYQRTLDIGFYCADIDFGVMTDVGAQSVATILGVAGIVIGNPFQNTTRTYFGAFGAAVAGGFSYTSAAAGNNYTFKTWLLQRIL